MPLLPIYSAASTVQTSPFQYPQTDRCLCYSDMYACTETRDNTRFSILKRIDASATYGRTTHVVAIEPAFSILKRIDASATQIVNGQNTLQIDRFSILKRIDASATHASA